PPNARAYSPASSSARADALRAESLQVCRPASTEAARPASAACHIVGRTPGPTDLPPGTSDRNVKLLVKALVSIHKIRVHSSYPTNQRRHNASTADTADTSNRRTHHVTRS